MNNFTKKRSGTYPELKKPWNSTWQYLHVQEGWVGDLDDRILCSCYHSLSLTPIHQSWRHLILMSRVHGMHTLEICSHWKYSKKVRWHLLELEVNYICWKHLLCSHHFVCFRFSFISFNLSCQPEVWNFWVHVVI